MTAPAPVPLLKATEPLGSVARPAGGRRPLARFAFAVCYAPQLDAVERHTAETLARWAGPTRAGLITTEAHTGDAIGRALEALAELGQGPDVLLRLAEAVHAMTAGRPDLEVLLVVATCRVLWPQTSRLVGQS